MAATAVPKAVLSARSLPAPHVPGSQIFQGGGGGGGCFSHGTTVASQRCCASSGAISVVVDSVAGGQVVHSYVPSGADERLVEVFLHATCH